MRHQLPVGATGRRSGTSWKGRGPTGGSGGPSESSCSGRCSKSRRYLPRDSAQSGLFVQLRVAFGHTSRKHVVTSWLRRLSSHHEGGTGGAARERNDRVASKHTSASPSQVSSGDGTSARHSGSRCSAARAPSRPSPGPAMFGTVYGGAVDATLE